MNSSETTIVKLPAIIEPSFQKQEPIITIDRNLDGLNLPRDASFSDYPTRICCPRCSFTGMSNMLLEAGTATWLWCVLLFPFAGMGLCCLCFNSCKDKIHLCTRCGAVIGRKTANVC